MKSNLFCLIWRTVVIHKCKITAKLHNFILVSNYVHVCAVTKGVLTPTCISRYNLAISSSDGTANVSENTKTLKTLKCTFTCIWWQYNEKYMRHVIYFVTVNEYCHVQIQWWKLIHWMCRVANPVNCVILWSVHYDLATWIFYKCLE